jgi:molecular chaperone GrpE
VATDDVALDRTVAALLEPGLEADGRSVRPARVAVHRLRAPDAPQVPAAGGG